MAEYLYKLCPLCEQGSLVFAYRADTQAVYLHCDECDLMFENLFDCESAARGKRNDEHRYHYQPATLEQIKEVGWEKYVLET